MFYKEIHTEPTQENTCGLRPYQCSICDKRFTQASHLNTHQILHTDYEQRPYPCSIIDNRYTRASDLETHEIMHTDLRYTLAVYVMRKSPEETPVNTYRPVSDHTSAVYAINVSPSWAT